MQSLFKSTLAAVVAGLSLNAAQAAVIQTYDFEGGGGAGGTGLDGWNIITTGVGDDLAFAPVGAQPVIPTAYGAGVQGQWAIRTWDNQVTGSTADGSTGGIRTDPFTLPTNATVDFLIGGGNHPWGAMDPDTLAVGPASLNLERLAGAGDWETIFTATGPNANELTAGPTWDASAFGGDTVRFAIYDLQSGGWGHIDVDNIVLSGDPIPEPSSLGLIGLVGALLLLRRKR